MAPLRRSTERVTPGGFRDDTPTLRGDAPTRKMRARPDLPRPGAEGMAAPTDVQSGPPPVHERLLASARERFEIPALPP
jgi:hypothetical protein